MGSQTPIAERRNMERNSVELRGAAHHLEYLLEPLESSHPHPI